MNTEEAKGIIHIPNGFPNNKNVSTEFVTKIAEKLNKIQFL